MSSHKPKRLKYVYTEMINPKIKADKPVDNIRRLVQLYINQRERKQFLKKANTTQAKSNGKLPE